MTSTFLIIAAILAVGVITASVLLTLAVGLEVDRECIHPVGPGPRGLAVNTLCCLTAPLTMALTFAAYAQLLGDAYTFSIPAPALVARVFLRQCCRPWSAWLGGR
ncbi:MAG TPA: hypothetical protein PKE26_03615 [Kiritimatiellia bacterium]|nr:hypothetical protein [Kiritimatiellia bacterium]HMO98178.1 hypothetical protein [Kiritimatiellia bacterium]